MSYRVFVRNWWKRDAYGMLVPDPSARKTTLRYVASEEEAQDECQKYGKTRKPGELSRKAEYEKE